MTVTIVHIGYRHTSAYVFRQHLLYTLYAHKPHKLGNIVAFSFSGQYEIVWIQPPVCGKEGTSISCDNISQ